MQANDYTEMIHSLTMEKEGISVVIMTLNHVQKENTDLRKENERLQRELAEKSNRLQSITRDFDQSRRDYTALKASLQSQKDERLQIVNIQAINRSLQSELQDLRASSAKSRQNEDLTASESARRGVAAEHAAADPEGLDAVAGGVAEAGEGADVPAAAARRGVRADGERLGATATST